MMIEKLAKQFGIEILGSPERGGYIYASRYWLLNLYSRIQGK
jgi:hypothetical protein